MGRSKRATAAGSSTTAAVNVSAAAAPVKHKDEKAGAIAINAELELTSDYLDMVNVPESNGLPNSGYLVLRRGEAVRILYLGSDATGDEGWCYAEVLRCIPPPRGASRGVITSPVDRRGWLPTAAITKPPDKVKKKEPETNNVTSRDPQETGGGAANAFVSVVSGSAADATPGSHAATVAERVAAQRAAVAKAAAKAAAKVAKDNKRGGNGNEKECPICMEPFNDRRVGVLRACCKTLMCSACDQKSVKVNLCLRALRSTALALKMADLSEHLLDMEVAYGTSFRTVCDSPTAIFGLGDCKTLPRHLPSLFAGVLVYSAGMYLNCLSQAALQFSMATYYDDWKSGPDNKPLVLWDIGYFFIDVYGLHQDWLPSPDWFAMVATLVVIVRFALLPGPMSLRWTIIRRWLALSGVLFGLRSFSIMSTVLPNPDKTCQPVIYFPNNVWREAYALFWHYQGSVTCQDVLYSGHTVGITLSVLFVDEYLPRSPWFHRTVDVDLWWTSPRIWIKPVLVVYAIMSYFAIIQTKFHYTADVFIGALMTFFVFKAYHHAIRGVELQEASGCTFRLLQWFESRAEDLMHWRLVAERRMHAMQNADLDLAQELIQASTEGYAVAADTSLWAAGVMASFKSEAPPLDSFAQTTFSGSRGGHLTKQR